MMVDSPPVGRRAEFVRWIPTRDGWEPELVSGLFAGWRTKNAWLVLSDENQPLELPIDEWDWCAA